MSPAMNIGSLLQHVNTETSSAFNDVANQASNIDVTDMTQMTQMQFKMMRMNLGIQMTATMTKDLSDSIKILIQKMGS